MSPVECLICSPFASNGWAVGAVAFVTVAIFLAVGGGRIIGIWLCDPVGPGLPLLAWIIVFAAPQMADMLAGMNSKLGGPTPTLWRMLELGLGVLLLGVQGWCWTRAAHNARLGFTDDALIANAGIAPALTWQERAAPRLVLVPTTMIAVSPVVLACQHKMPWASVTWGGVIVAVAVSIVLWIVSILRRHFVKKNQAAAAQAAAAPAPAQIQVSGPRIVKLFHAAPHHPLLPAVLLALALIGLVVIQLCPDFVNDTFDTPSASLIALSCVVPFGSFLLAGLRDGIEWFLARADKFGRWLLHVFHPPAPPLALIAKSADVLGVIALIALPVGDSYLFERTFDFYNVPHLDAAKRPNLDQALQKYVDCRADWHEAEHMPAIIVASEGGASRSAVWTLSVMRMLDAKTGGAFGAHLFAISSVSGGSLGAVTYNIAQRGKFGIAAKAPTPADQTGFWTDNLTHVVELGRTDLLSSAIADMFTSDMALGFPRRGPALAHAFEHLWNQQFSRTDTSTLGFLGMRHDGGDTQSCLPQLILNGTDVDSGNRLLTSSIELGEAPDDGSTDAAQWHARPFADAVDVIYQRDSDFPASAAVLNSARFPLISPPGRLPHSKGDGTVVASDVRTQDFEVIDGGVFDDYSGRTAWELADAIREDPKWHDRLDPIVVLITNDAEDDPVTCDDPSGPPGTAASAKPAAAGTATPLQPGQTQGGISAPEILSSLLGLYNVRGAHARTELATLYRKYCATTAAGPRQGKEPPAPAAVHFDLPQPDVDKGQAAPMNWVLDESSCAYMLGKARAEKKNPDQADKLLQRLKSDAVAVGSDTFDAVVNSDPAGCSAP